MMDKQSIENSIGFQSGPAGIVTEIFETRRIQNSKGRLRLCLV